MTYGKHSLTAVKVWCPVDAWKGERVPRDGSARYGPCPQCGGAVIPATQLADRRVAKAKAELAEQNDAIVTRATADWLRT